MVKKCQFWSTFRVMNVHVEVGRWSKKGKILFSSSLQIKNRKGRNVRSSDRKREGINEEEKMETSKERRSKGCNEEETMAIKKKGDYIHYCLLLFFIAF